MVHIEIFRDQTLAQSLIECLLALANPQAVIIRFWLFAMRNLARKPLRMYSPLRERLPPVTYTSHAAEIRSRKVLQDPQPDFWWKVRPLHAAVLGRPSTSLLPFPHAWINPSFYPPLDYLPFPSLLLFMKENRIGIRKRTISAHSRTIPKPPQLSANRLTDWDTPGIWGDRLTDWWQTDRLTGCCLSTW